ncbi:PEP-CTERM sorting domain-containing protein [Psychromonas sp. KJ10-2]|uniref:PEP-CTERM sorting domain-containing protein n=1 Tax=Psychromonas sp. KJ10-2 TaxID=3391822 RepID=UPI0039B6476A
MIVKHWMILASAVIAPLASATTITFDDLDNGTRVDDEYLSTYGVTFDGVNVDRNKSNLAVVFDSTLDNTADPDLESPFTNVNNPSLGVSNPGNILIIHENPKSCDAFTCSNPDDEGSRPAGYFTIDFSESVILKSIDFFDVEYTETNTNTAIHLYDVNGLELNIGEFFTPSTGGDNTWDRLYFDVADVSSIEINLYGSGAISNIDFTASTTSVPEPTTLAVFAMGLMGLVGIRRQQRKG